MKWPPSTAENRNNKMSYNINGAIHNIQLPSQKKIKLVDKDHRENKDRNKSLGGNIHISTQSLVQQE